MSNGEWIIPQHSKGRVDRAGDAVANRRGFPATDEDFEVLNNWRGSHAFPLNTIQNGVRLAAKTHCAQPLIAQRIKRVPSIVSKLQRFDGMQLSNMQDLGGCRAILTSASQAVSLRNHMLSSRWLHEKKGQKDYIEEPQDTGYRGLHLIYAYKSRKQSQYNGLKVEVQIRSAHQHAWATAVETVAAFLQQALKSNRGSTDWLRFFSLAGSAYAIIEKTPLVPGTPSTQKELNAELRHLYLQLEVRMRLTAFKVALNVLMKKAHASASYYLLILNIAQNHLSVQSYTKGELERATADYLRAESKVGGQADAVLVSAQNIKKLRSAYPNYFADTDKFLQTIGKALD